MKVNLTGVFEVKEIKKKTSAKFFKDLKVGDVFELSYSMNGFYGGSPTIDILGSNGVKHMNNPNQLRNNMFNFEIEQIS
ncbi:hypothetical protein [Halobacillus karajensis]|uniref:hypothetical protein n=1 Tax=Halobacillus karajensis TaxID=195088 RepID=UPI00045C6744|nr:hypothetical protein [Halobacillus karajensis]CDQ21747.1 hypothetical protein BN982_04156 [Halobacillus karajensis]